MVGGRLSTGSEVPCPEPWWTDWAACRGESIQSFYSEPGISYADLRWRDLCFECPVRVDCLAEALRSGEQWGVWGGFTPNARRRLARLLEQGAVSWQQVSLTVSDRSARLPP